MSNVNRNRKLVVRSALAVSSTIAILAGAEALMIQDTQTNSASAAQFDQTGTSDQNINGAQSNSNIVTIRSSNGTTRYYQPSQSFSRRTRSSR